MKGRTESWKLQVKSLTEGFYWFNKSCQKLFSIIMGGHLPPCTVYKQSWHLNEKNSVIFRGFLFLRMYIAKIQNSITAHIYVYMPEATKEF